MKDRRGKILITGKVYSEQLENVSMALAEIGFVPFRVKQLAMEDLFELKGCSNAFRRLDGVEVLPEYMLVIEVDDDGNYERANVSAVNTCISFNPETIFNIPESG